MILIIQKHEAGKSNLKINNNKKKNIQEIKTLTVLNYYYNCIFFHQIII